MSTYPFHAVKYEREDALEDQTLLAQRPFSKIDRSFEADARRFVPGEQLDTVISDCGGRAAADYRGAGRRQNSDSLLRRV